MPTTYAHYTFGGLVLDILNNDVKKLISKHINLFNIGLHGPDILFYFKPLSNNKISKVGHEVHSMNAVIFFENAKKVIRECPDSEAACAYIMGYICHFMLDSECHPYIREKESDKITHSEIETEFDRLLMIKNNINPLSFKPTSHIVPKIDYAKCISCFYQGITYKEISRALKSMKFYLNLIVAPGNLKRSIIITALKLSGNYENMIALIMNYQQNTACDEISHNLQELYTKAIVATADIINEYYKNLSNSEPINKRFIRNFE